MARYVVAGATGRVGSVVADELLAQGADTTVIVRTQQCVTGWARRGASVALGSLDDAAFLSQTLRDADGFFVLLPENVDPTDFHGARRRMADAIATAVATSRVPHVVMLSALAAILPDGNGPAKDLHALERRLRTTAGTLSTFRACYFQENVSAVVEPARQAGIYPNFLPSADAAFPMIATCDIGRFAATALLRPPANSEIVDLFGPSYSVRDVAELLGHALGRPLQVVDVPAAQHVATLTQAGTLLQVAEAVAELFSAFAAGSIVPRGDRSLMGATTLDQVIRSCLRRPAATAPIAS